MRIFLIMAMAVGVSGVAFAAGQKADPRALEECKKKDAAFTAIADCLPEADVSFKVLDAFATIYPSEAQPLKAKCLELNSDSTNGAATCVTEAISKAIELKKSLPDGTTLGDPIFDAAVDETLSAKLAAAEKQAKKNYPDRSYWGGTMYHPYK